MRWDIGQSIIAPSLLSADFSILKDEIRDVENAGADWLHVDVMDGHFVPNITIGPIVVQSIRKDTRSILDCHLMVSDPEKWIEPFAKAGADVITIHAEAEKNLKPLLKKIKNLKCKAGVSINPNTPAEILFDVLDDVDLVLVMSVYPGFGGQKFISEVLEKVKILKAKRGKRKYLIEIDGGITHENILSTQEAGCDVFVAGSSVFGKKNRKEAIQILKKKLGEK